jgi:hypothetical protein
MEQEGSVQIEMRELPTGVDGRRLVSSREIVEMLRDPKMRDAVDLIERASGRETAIKRMLRKQFTRDRVACEHERHERRLIELAMKKKSGKLFK